jgi:hypothetical protein
MAGKSWLVTVLPEVHINNPARDCPFSVVISHRLRDVGQDFGRVGVGLHLRPRFIGGERNREYGR